MEQLFNGNFDYQPHRMRGRNHSVCHLEVLKHEDAALVIATDLNDNPGMSITNSSEQLATAVVNRFYLSPTMQKIVFIEHYNDQISYGHSQGLAGARGEHDEYSQVSYAWKFEEFYQAYVANKPQWSHIPAEKVEWLRGNLETGFVNIDEQI